MIKKNPNLFQNGKASARNTVHLQGKSKILHTSSREKYQPADGTSVSESPTIKVECSLIYLSGTWTTTFLTMGGEFICFCAK